MAEAGNEREDTRAVAPTAAEEPVPTPGARRDPVPPETRGVVAPAPAGLFARLKQAGELRDTLLVIGGVIYVLGYLAFSLHAYKNDLGLLSAFEAQYFTAGIIPFVIVCLAVAGFVALKRLNDRFQEWLLKDTPARNVARKWMWVAAPVVFIGGLLVLSAGWLDDVPPVLYVGFIFTYILLLGLLFPPEKDRAGWSHLIDTAYRLFQFSMLTAFTCLLAFVFYLDFYAGWPQELGGVKPRCAALDLSAEQVSAETLRELTPAGVQKAAGAEGAPPAGAKEPAAGAEKIVRSTPVEVLFSGNDIMFVKRKLGRVYELKRAAVQTVTPCSAAEAAAY